MTMKKETEEEKRKREQLNKGADNFLENLAKGSKETLYGKDGFRITAYQQGKDTRKRAGVTPASSSKGSASLKSANISSVQRVGGTVNPVSPISVKMPTMADFRALTVKKQPTVNINLDQKPMQNRATINPSVGAAFWANKPQRSTSFDRKTMLYETNDSLLSPQEVLEKYRYVVNDKEMDSDTRDLAAKKGLVITGRLRDKSIFSGDKNIDLLNAISSLQGDLTYMTKAYARGKGYGDAFGLSYLGNKLSDNYVEKSGDAGLKATVEARKKLAEKTVADNPLSVGAGRFIGEGMKYAAFSPIIEGQVARATSALGAGMGTSPLISKGLQFGGNILGQQTADTLLSTPTVILDGMTAGKNSKQIVSDVAKQQLMDLGFNLGFGALQAGGNLLKYKKAALESSKRSKVDELLAGRVALPSPRRETDFIAGNHGIAVGNNGAYDDWLMEIAKAAQAAAQDSKNSMTALPPPSNILYASRDGSLFDSLATKNLWDQKNTPVIQNPYSIYHGKQMLEKKTNSIAELSALKNAGLSKTKKIDGSRDDVLQYYGIDDIQSPSVVVKKITEKTKNSILSTKGNVKPFVNEETGLPIEIWKNGINETFFKGKYYPTLSDEMKIAKIASIEHLPELIGSGKVRAPEALNYHDTNAKSSFVYLENKARLNGQDYIVTIDVKKLPDGSNRFYVHDIKLREATGASRDSSLSGPPLRERQPVTSNNSISKIDENINHNLLKMEDAKPTSVASPPDTSKTATRQPSKQILSDKFPNINNKAEIGATSTKDMEGLFNDRYQMKKELVRAEKRSQLTNWEKDKVSQLLHGETTMEEVEKAATSAKSTKRIADVYDVEKQFRQVDGKINDYRAAKKAERSNMIADVVGELRMAKKGENGWKDMGPILMGRSTQERILEKVTDKETAKRINERIFEPIHTAERDRQLFMKNITDRVKKLNIDTKKKFSVKDADGQAYQLSESGLVHYLGSKRYQLQQLEKKGNRLAQEDVELINRLRMEVSAAESVVSKDELTKIDKGIQLFQYIYKKIHPRINEVLIKNGYDPIGYIDGYFPNMFFDDATDPMGKALQKIGFDFTSKELPMDIAGRTETFRPGKKWAGNLLERTSDKTDYDALRAMDKYLDDISDVIYHTDNIKTLREYEEHLRYTLSPDGVKAEADAIKKNPEYSPETIRTELDNLYEKNKQNHTLQNYVNNIRRYTDLLAGKKHSLDRALETDIFGRSVYKAVNTIESRIGANMVAGNIGSALTNVIPITQGMGAMSTSSNVKGLKEAMQSMFKDGMDDLTQKSAFLTTRQGREMLYQTGLQKATNIAVAPMEIMDKFSTQAVWRSRFYDNIKKGLEENKAILEADDYCRRLFAGRSKGSMPTYFHSKALKPLTMFQLEVNNQLDFLLKDLPKEAHGSAVKAMKIYSGVLLGAYVYNDMYEKLTGRRSALDPIGIANEAVQDFTGTGLRNTFDIGGDLLKGNGLHLTETADRKKASEAAGNLVENVGGNVPFVGGILFDGGRIPLSAADPDLGSVGGAVFDAAAGDGSWEKAGKVAVKNLSNPLYYAALPFGGSQLRKTIGGLNTMAKGGSYSTTNNGQRLQFPVDQSSPAKWVQAGVLGKWALPEAQGYLDGQTKALSEKRTSTYEKLQEKGIVNMQAYGAIGKVMQAGSSEEKRSALRLVPIREEGRPIIYYDLIASEKDKGIMDTLQRMGEEDYTIYDCVEQLTDSKADNRKRNILMNSKLTEESKKYVYREKVTKDDDERIYNFSQAGMNMDEFLKVKNYLYIAKERSLPTAQKRQMFVNWVLDKGYTSEQRSVIYEEFNIAKKYRR